MEEAKESEKIIEERTKDLSEFFKKVFNKNIYCSVFLILTIAFFIISIFVLINPSIPLVNFLSFLEWITLAIALLISLIFSYYEKWNLMIIPLVLWLLLLGIGIRSLPMQDHGGKPGLWDITTNNWTLGPDLDPWVFQRYADTINENGSLPRIDEMRNVPLGFDTTTELQMVSYMILVTHKIVNVFGDYNILFSAVFMPVLFFALTIIAFFFFVREIFLKDKDSRARANIIAFVACIFMIIIPVFLSRTVAGIPEKESVGFFFMFLAFYLFLKSWKSKKIITSSIFGILAGIATALMGLTWGGVLYAYISIALATFLAFLLNKVGKKEGIAYTLWIVAAISLTLIFSNRTDLRAIITSISSGFSVLVLLIILIHLGIWNTKIKKYFEKISKTIPKNLISLIIAIILIGIIATLIFGPSFIGEKIKAVNQVVFKPVTGRWSTTVAENKQPYFTEWGSEFGPFVKNIPILFWMFFIGSIVLFKKMLNKLKGKDAWILTAFYTLFLFCIIFSRYAPHPAILDGDGIASKIIYYASILLLLGSFLFYYIRYNRDGNKGFENIEYQFLFFFAVFVVALLTARGAIRLIMVLAPFAVILCSYLIIDIINRFRNSKDDTMKVILGVIMIVVLIAGFYSVYAYTNSVKSQAYNYIPSSYNQQWQKAMEWVRNETPSNTVFAHWWDYGYWVQSIGKRATVLDGGNAIAFWNYWMGRMVLTGDNQKDSLEFLYNHNATHLLIDSSDIGKYGAFSSIGSDKNYDRYSWIGTFLMDDKQTQETKNQTLYVYSGGVALDEDLVLNESGKEILMPGQKTGVGAIVVPTEENGNESGFGQPFVMMQYNGNVQKVYLRYLDVGGKFIDFKTGIEACAFIFPRIIPDGQGHISKNDIGAAMFLSPRLMRGYLTQKYILDDPFKKFTNFKLVHSEPSFIVNSLNSQGMNLPEFVYYDYGGLYGPIKIWEIKYTGNEKVQQKYLDIDATKYIDWQL